MAYYQLHNHKSVEALKKKQRIKVVTDSESEIISMSDIIHDIVSSSEEYIDKYSEKENIAIEIEEKKPGAGQRPQARRCRRGLFLGSCGAGCLELRTHCLSRSHRLGVCTPLAG